MGKRFNEIMEKRNTKKVKVFAHTENWFKYSINHEWEDVNNIKWRRTKNGRVKIAKIMGPNLGNPMWCPECGKLMRDYDTIYYIKANMCSSCVIKIETNEQIRKQVEVNQQTS